MRFFSLRRVKQMKNGYVLIEALWDEEEQSFTDATPFTCTCKVDEKCAATMS